MQPIVYDAPSKQFLLHKLRCASCGAEGVELTTLVMYHVRSIGQPDQHATTNVHSLICVECNRAIRKGVPSLKQNQWQDDPLAHIGGQALLYETTVRIRLNKA